MDPYTNWLYNGKQRYLHDLSISLKLSTVTLVFSNTSRIKSASTINVTTSLPLPSNFLHNQFPFKYIIYLQTYMILELLNDAPLFPDPCIIQEIGPQRMIGTGGESGSLYHLEIGASFIACVSSNSLRDLHC